MSLLTIVQSFCQRTGIPVPAAVAVTTDTQVVQILSLLNEVCEDLVDRSSWQALVKEVLFTTVAGEDQGTIASLAPYGFSRVVQETIYNRTLRLPIYGPIQPNQWQALKALPSTGPFYKYRITHGHLLFNPVAVAAHTCAFEYVSTYAVLAADGTTYKPAFTVDTDTSVFDDRLLIAGLRWKWKAEKGLEYGEDLRRYEELVNNASCRDATKPRLYMDSSGNDFRPGIWVPAGNWNLS